MPWSKRRYAWDWEIEANRNALPVSRWSPTLSTSSRKSTRTASTSLRKNWKQTRSQIG